MTSYTPSDSAVFRRLIEPAFAAYEDSPARYRCTGLGDLDFIEMGVARALSDSRTGRDFLQRHADGGRKEVCADLFFKALKSKRRLANLGAVNTALAGEVGRCREDPFEAVPELRNFALYAGDGHFHGAAAHDPKLESSGGGHRKYATGHFFTLDLRTHHASLLATAEQGGGRKGEHDMRAIKRAGTDALRGGQPKGTKVLLAWDPAGIDFAFWQKAKQTSGLYFISREKLTMNLTVVGEREIDRALPENAGVLRDEIVVPAGGGGRLRRITYEDTATGRTFTYITTEMTLPPWVLALVYKHRWDIEKVFDEFKNKLYERKSWGSGAVAKAVHAQFLCLAHNLMTILEADIARDAGVRDEREIGRRLERADAALENGASFVATFIQRLTVRTLKFVRWLRNHIYKAASWDEAVARLRHTYAST